jgi:hypothetical protein
MELSQSFESSRIIYDPIINEIFEMKSCKTVKYKSLVWTIVSVAICFITAFGMYNMKLDSDSVYYKCFVWTMLLIVFLVFFMNIFQSVWLFVSNATLLASISQKSANLNSKQKKLLGIEDLNTDEKIGKKTGLIRKRCIKQIVPEEKSVQKIPTPKIPFFALSPIKNVNIDERVLLSQSLSESIQHDANKERSLLYKSKLNDDSFQSNSFRNSNITTDYLDDKQNDKSMELRSNQYQIGTKAMGRSQMLISFWIGKILFHFFVQQQNRCHLRANLI